MRRSCGLLALVAAASSVGCADVLTSSKAPTLSGVIVSRASFTYAAQHGDVVGLDSFPTMLVDGGATGHVQESFGGRAYFIIGPHTRVYRNRVQADTADLRVGQKVTVWGIGPALESAPPYWGAGYVLLR